MEKSPLPRLRIAATISFVGCSMVCSVRCSVSSIRSIAKTERKMRIRCNAGRPRTMPVVVMNATAESGVVLS